MSVVYGPASPLPDPLQTQPPPPGSAPYPVDEPVAGVPGVDPSEGGQSGDTGILGYSNGLNGAWTGAPFTGGTVEGQWQDLAAITGPVGVTGYGPMLEAGVASQGTVYPSQEDLYRAMVSSPLVNDDE